MKQTLRWIAFMLTVLLFAACSNSSGTAGGSEATPEEAARTVNQAFTGLTFVYEPLQALKLTDPVIILSQGYAPLSAQEWLCENARAEGDLSDKDGDGIPVDAVINGECTWSYETDGASFQGSWGLENYRFADPDDRDPYAGFMGKGRALWSLDTGGTKVEVAWTADRHDLVRQGEVWNLNYQGTIEHRVTLGEKELVYAEFYALEGKWTPDDPQTPSGAGKLNAEGRIWGSGPNCPEGWRFEARYENLHLTPYRIDGGTARMTGTYCDGAQVTIEFEWTENEVCYTFSSDKSVVRNCFLNAD